MQCSIVLMSALCRLESLRSPTALRLIATLTGSDFLQLRVSNAPREGRSSCWPPISGIARSKSIYFPCIESVRAEFADVLKYTSTEIDAKHTL